ncbi:hypothetical protein HMPREF1246_0680 [Acidaminococcus sp. BV3L6]|nr:hypothetical protein HMPREF1246_0680 [Acidaminococcus sp. BV3L6]
MFGNGGLAFFPDSAKAFDRITILLQDDPKASLTQGLFN